MRYPRFLKSKGKIGFIAPSFGCTIEPYRSDFEDALSWFKSRGYETVLGPNCFCDNGIGISNTPQACAAEVNDFLPGDKSDVIISCGGGELMCEILPYVDFDRIAKADPKWFMGYSDNTNLTFLLNTLCDTASIYSVCAPKFNDNMRHKCVDDALRYCVAADLPYQIMISGTKRSQQRCSGTGLLTTRGRPERLMI